MTSLMIPNIPNNDSESSILDDRYPITVDNDAVAKNQEGDDALFDPTFFPV